VSGVRASAGEVTAFQGFPDEALLFYEGLEADNSKSYWTDQRDRYERAVRGPMLALLTQLEPEFGPGKLFRPYRDVRFSADKTPYKTHAGAVVGSGDAGGVLYVQISADGLLVGAGYYRMAPDQLSRFRESVAADGPGDRLARELAALQAEGWTPAGERLSRAPRGHSPDHPRIELLKHKGIAAMRGFGTPDWLGTPRCGDEVAVAWRRVGEFTRWLDRHVGPAEQIEGDPRSARARRVTPD
jgi:uncharacterized protein (TIGR02453 family)